MKPAAILSCLFVSLAASAALLRADAPATPATPATLQPIRYERTGGFASAYDVIEISKEGTIIVQGKLVKTALGQLTKEQIAKLVGVFDQWNTLKASYPAPPGTADGFTIKLRYGQKEVTASDMNADLPESFKTAQATVEDLAKSLTKK